MPGASNTRRKLGGRQCGRNLREDWDGSCLHGTRWVQMEQSYKVNVFKSGFTVTNHDITVPTTQVCDHTTQLWLCVYRLCEHFEQGENLEIMVVELGKFVSLWNFHKSDNISQTYRLYFIAIFLFKALCGNGNPSKCPKLWWVFIYMNNWANGDLGVKEDTWAVAGKDTVSSPENTAYALCALELLSPSNCPLYIDVKVIIWKMIEKKCFFGWGPRSTLRLHPIVGL